MIEIFLKVINMSISASYLVLAVLLIRFLLKKAPKWVRVLLWGIVAVRLLCPFSFESILSLIPSAETIPEQVISGPSFDVHTGIPQIDAPVNDYIGDRYYEGVTVPANQGFRVMTVLTVIWLAGIIAMLLYTAVSYALLKRRVRTAVRVRDNIFQSEYVDSPFVLGIVKPKIYLQLQLDEEKLAYVVAHEQAHIRRKDHLWKPVGFLLLAAHWFNPLMWLGYVLLCRDIEFACDEKVIKEMDSGAKADYTQALVDCSVNRRRIAACPLAFGEVGVKERVKSVLHYKKPAVWLVAVAVIVCVAVAVCFLTNPKNENYGETDPEKLSSEQILLLEKVPAYFGLNAAKGLDVYVWQMAKNSYSFGLLPHTDGMRNWLSDGLMEMKGVRAADMRRILATYQVEQEDIYVIPWQNPLSSYIGDYWLVTNEEDTAARRKAYVENVRRMLFEAELDQNLQAPEFGPVHTYFPGVEMQITGVSGENGKTLEVVWRNRTEHEMMYGEHFEIMQLVDGQWVLCELKENIVFPDIGYIVKAGEERTETYDISHAYIVTEPGRYRFSTSCSVQVKNEDPKICEVWAEFTLSAED